MVVGNNAKPGLRALFHPDGIGMGLYLVVGA
jgi:hypothetical protein